MTATIQTYLDLITLEHGSQPNYTAMISVLCQPLVDSINQMSQMQTLFDIDTAIGQQLDIVGQWVGITRYVDPPIIGVYFAWDTAGVGWDQGVWKLPTDPTFGLVVLPDDHYRALLKARVLNNHWDGDIEDAYAIMNTTFNVFGYFIAIKDNGNLTMDLILVGPVAPDALLLDMFDSGELDIRPAGVQVTSRTWVPFL
jgi:hypothetical protein